MGVRRIYVEKKRDFAIRAKELLSELRSDMILKIYRIMTIKEASILFFVNRRLITVMRAAFHIKTETFSLL